MGNRPSAGERMDWDLMRETLPEEILTLILSHLPAKEIIHNCRPVCKAWKELADHATVWTTKYERDYGRSVQPVLHPLLDIRKVYVHNTFSENLAATSEVKIVARGGHQMAEERRADDEVNFPGAYAGPFPGCRSVWAFSYLPGAIKFTIDLLNKGLSQEFIDTVTPPISVSVWTAARADCGSIFKFTTWLDDESEKSMAGFRCWILRSDGYESEEDENVVTDVSPQKFSFIRKVEQWTGGDWYEGRHTFTAYPAGIRYIHCVMEGKDTQFWAGNYGPKFTKPGVQVSMS